jgi:hypothetical protein
MRPHLGALNGLLACAASLSHGVAATVLRAVKYSEGLDEPVAGAPAPSPYLIA